MKITILVAAVVALAQAAPLINNGGQAISGSYIIVLKNGQTAASFSPKFNSISQRQNGRGRKPTISRQYKNFPGFAAILNDAALKELLASEDVDYVEQDSIVTALGTQTNPPSWGLTRISQHARDLTQPYYFNDAQGQGITAYVIDTGINVQHVDFGGRASWGANFVTGSVDTDENGHGTAVAAIIGGDLHGVAKKILLKAVKVLDAQGSGSTSAVIGGMDWVASNAVPGKSVVNMSLGGGKSQAINDAAQRLFAKNIPLFAASGNSGNSCDTSPAGAPNVFTVGSSDGNDKVASLTTNGACIEIFAPGQGIKTAWIGSNTATTTLSGTSFATAFVSGTAGLYLSFNTIPTAQGLFDKVINTATLNVLTGNFNGAPNRLVYNGGP